MSVYKLDELRYELSNFSANFTVVQQACNESPFNAFDPLPRIGDPIEELTISLSADRLVIIATVRWYTVKGGNVLCFRGL